MKHLAITIILAFSAASAMAMEPALETAIYGQSADVASTAVGLSISGIAEANPLGLSLLVIKPVTITYANSLEEPSRTEVLTTVGAAGWGAFYNNLCAIAVALTWGSSSLACIIPGIIGGVAAYKSTEPLREAARSKVNE